MKIFNTAIVGLGKIGFESDAKIARRYVLSYARAFSLHRGFKLAAGFDIDKDKLAAFEKEYRVPGYHYKDLRKHLKDIEAVVISVPAKEHFEVFKEVVSSCRPAIVIMEKPLALDLGQAGEMVRIAKNKKILLYVNYFRRVDKGINRLRHQMNKRRFGRLANVDIYYGQDLLNNASHFIDLMLYLVGHPDSIKLLPGRDRNNPDFVFYYKQLPVRFKSSIGVNYNLKEMDFIFEKARVRYSCLPLTQLMLPKARSCFGIRELTEVRNRDLHLDLERYMLIVAEHIYNVLSGRSKLISSGRTALQTLKVCFDIMRKGSIV